MKNCNSGYIGFSMSVRALQARNNEFLPKTDFKKEFGISEKVFKEFIKNSDNYDYEWHHTSKFFNKTNFYKPTLEGLAYLADYSELANEMFINEVNKSEEKPINKVEFSFEKKYEGTERIVYMQIDKKSKHQNILSWQNPNSPNFVYNEMFTEILNRL